ncbi:MAG: tetratricopeptide repeat protein [Bryobacteraceae bacterium]|nr:tetratricopeptide repeat protein [Bryobacteraceae bacterium]
MKKLLGVFGILLPLTAQPVADKAEIVAQVRATVEAQVRSATEQARTAMSDARRAMESYRDSSDSYHRGTRALDSRDYDRAVTSFDRAITAKSPRLEGAYYWKAYALGKLGKRDEALAVLATLAKEYPQSRWLNDAKVLTAELQQATGQGVSPESQSDEDLKLYAINALVNTDPDRAVPLLQKLLSEAKASPRMKERALFVLAQSPSEAARNTVSQCARGGANPDLQLRAVEYLGAFRAKESQQALAEIYAGTTDVNLKRAVLRGYRGSRDTEHLLTAAKSETNPELRREAIDALGSLQATNELTQLYAAESNFEWKERLLRAMSRGQNTAKLLEVARTDKDSRLRLAAVRSLSSSRKGLGPDDLTALYATEPEVSVRGALLDALCAQGSAAQLVEVTRKESNAELKRRAVQRLSGMKSKEATDYLIELLK